MKVSNTEVKKQTAPQPAYPKVKKSALIGPKRPTGRPKPLATKLGVTTKRKRLY